MKSGVEFPLVKITLQGMEHSIIHAMTEHFASMDDACKKAIEQAVKDFDYAAEVRQAAYALVKDAIRTALEKELRYGASYDAITNVAGEMIRRQLDELGKKAK